MELIIRCKLRVIIAVGCLKPKGITSNGNSNLSVHDLLPPVTIILLKENCNAKTS